MKKHKLPILIANLVTSHKLSHAFNEYFLSLVEKKNVSIMMMMMMIIVIGIIIIIINILWYIICLILLTTTPQLLKNYLAKPLHKKGERNCILNFKPGTIMTSFSEIFEKVMYNRLLRHWNNNNILVDGQSGFRKKSNNWK